jgi:hypothetical protein
VHPEGHVAGGADGPGCVPAAGDLHRGRRYLPSLPLTFLIARFFDVTVDKMFDPEEGDAVS